jgi:hypothetical protein
VTDGLTAREESIAGLCTPLVEEMGGLRAFRAPPLAAHPADVHSALRDDLRARLDRAEQVLIDIDGYRRRALRAVAVREAAAAEAYDAELVKSSRRAVQRQYESIKDREVVARVAASQQYRALAAAKREAALVEQAHAAVRQMVFGLRDVREELLATLRYLPWEASMER